MWMKWMKEKNFGQLFQTKCLGGKKNGGPNHVPRGKRNNVPRIRGLNSPWEQLP